MAFPITNYTRIWVRGRIIDLAKAAREETSYGVTGPVQFVPSPNVLVDQGTDQVIDTKPFVVFPDAQDGYFQIQLPATNDPDINPTGWTYHVFEPTGRDYHIVVPYDTPALTTVGDPLEGEQVIELSDVVPNPDANPGTVQVLAGIAGRGITSVAINGSGHWIVTYTDSTTSDLGAATVPASISPTLVNAKGDLITATADDTPARLAAGSNGQVLTAQSGQTTGLLWTSTPVIPPVALTDASTIATDASLGVHFTVTATANRTLGVPTGSPVNGQRAIWAHTASGGARTLTLATGTGGFAFGTDITALSATASGLTDYIGCVYDSGAARWRVLAYAKGY